MTLDANDLLSALADPTRLRIVVLLFRHGELCVCELVNALDTHQPKVSKHLAILRKHALISGRRSGQWIHYRLNPELPIWAGNVIRELVTGCDLRSEFRVDEARLIDPASGTGCGVN